MKEDFQIENGARLADVKAPENLATDRARNFVSAQLKKKESGTKDSFLKRLFHSHIVVWGGFSVTFAACVTMAVVFLKPQSSEDSFEVMQEESIHAGTATVDSSALNQRDTLEVDFELPAK